MEQDVSHTSLVPFLQKFVNASVGFFSVIFVATPENIFENLWEFEIHSGNVGSFMEFNCFFLALIGIGEQLFLLR